MTIFYLLLLILFSPVVAGAEDGSYHDLLERIEKSYAKVRDYTAVFHRRERVGGVERPEEAIFLKFQKPFKVYLRWLSGPNRGREILYVESRFDGRALVHEASGLARFFSFLIDPAGERVLSESRYPLTDIGFGRLIELLSEDMRGNGSGIRIVDRGKAEIDDRPVRWLEGFIGRNGGSENSAHRVVLAVDARLHLPVQASVFDASDALLGKYRYSRIRLNPGLSESDFDPANPAYNFSSWRIPLSD